MIRLIDACLCIDCDTIFDEELSKDCPRCASQQSVRVDRYITAFENNLPSSKENT